MVSIRSNCVPGSAVIRCSSRSSCARLAAAHLQNPGGGTHQGRCRRRHCRRHGPRRQGAVRHLEAFYVDQTLARHTVISSSFIELAH